MATTSTKAEKTINITVKNPEQPQYGWRMYFNAYEIEPCGTGKLARFAFVRSGLCGEVLQIFFPQDVLDNIRKQSDKYLRTFSLDTIPSKLAIPVNGPRSFAAVQQRILALTQKYPLPY